MRTITATVNGSITKTFTGTIPEISAAIQVWLTENFTADIERD